MSEKSIIASTFSLTNNYAKEIKQRGYNERYNVRENDCTCVCPPDITVSLKHDRNRTLLITFRQTARAVSKTMLRICNMS